MEIIGDYSNCLSWRYWTSLVQFWHPANIVHTRTLMSFLFNGWLVVGYDDGGDDDDDAGIVH